MVRVEETRKLIESNPRLGFLYLALAAHFHEREGLKMGQAEIKAFKSLQGAPRESGKINPWVDRMLLSIHESRARALKRRKRKVSKAEGKQMQALQRRRRR